MLERITNLLVWKKPITVGTTRVIAAYPGQLNDLVGLDVGTSDMLTRHEPINLHPDSGLKEGDIVEVRVQMPRSGNSNECLATIRPFDASTYGKPGPEDQNTSMNHMHGRFSRSFFNKFIRRG